MGSRIVYKKIELGRYEVPTDALRLAEDIARLEEISHLLDRIDPVNCSQEKHVGIDALRMMRSMAFLCQQAAKRKLKDFHK